MLSILKDTYIKWLIAGGILVRLGIFLFFYTHVSIYPDSSTYIELADRIMEFNLSGYSGYRSPGYPLLLTAAFGNLYLVVCYQFSLGILSSIFWYRSLCKLRFSRKHSFLISFFITTLLNVIFFETSILVESLTLFLLSIVVYTLVKGYFETSTLKNELFLGIVLGLLTLVKPFYAFLPFLIYGIYILKNFRLKRLINKKLIILIFPLLSYFGWSYVNKINTGHFVSTTFFGLNVAQNCVRFAEKGPEEYNWIIEPYVEYREKAITENKNLAMSIWDAYNDGAYKQYNLSLGDLSAQLGQFATATIKNNPLDYAEQVLFYSWKDFWKPTIYWNYNYFNFKYANNLYLAIWYIQHLFLLGFRLLFLFLIPYYILKTIKTKQIAISFILCMVVFSASILQALATYGTNSRFSFPFEFIIIFVVFLFIKEQKIIPFLKKKFALVK